MSSTTTRLAAAVAIASLFAAPAALAFAEKDELVFTDFIERCDTDKDGMVSKAEVMKHVEKMFDKADTRKAGLIDRRQVEIFLRELMKNGG